MKLPLTLTLGLVLLGGPAWAVCTTAELTSKLTTDTEGIAFAAPIAAGQDAAVLSLANQRRAGAAFQVSSGLVPSYRVVNAFDVAEYEALTTAQLQRLATLLSPGQLDTSASNVRTILANIFPAAGPTRTALQALANRQGSWGEVKCGGDLTLREISLALHGTQ